MASISCIPKLAVGSNMPHIGNRPRKKKFVNFGNLEVAICECFLALAIFLDFHNEKMTVHTYVIKMNYCMPVTSSSVLVIYSTLPNNAAQRNKIKSHVARPIVNYQLEMISAHT